MKSESLKFLSLLFCSLFFLTAASVKGKTSCHFHLMPGIRYEYRVNYDGKVRNVHTVLYEDEVIDGIEYLVTGSIIDGSSIPYQKMYYLKDSLPELKLAFVLWEGKKFAYAPPLVVIPAEFAVGKKWSWEGKGPGEVNCSRSYVDKQETLELNGKSYPCIKVVTQFYTGAGERILVNTWYMRNIGKIKEETIISSLDFVGRNKKVKSSRHVVSELLRYERFKEL